jgi:hypothetical protein
VRVGHGVGRAEGGAPGAEYARLPLLVPSAVGDVR